MCPVPEAPVKLLCPKSLVLVVLGGTPGCAGGSLLAQGRTKVIGRKDRVLTPDSASSPASGQGSETHFQRSEASGAAAGKVRPLAWAVTITSSGSGGVGHEPQSPGQEKQQEPRDSTGLWACPPALQHPVSPPGMLRGQAQGTTQKVPHSQGPQKRGGS